MTRPLPSRARRGFTLVELMVVVVMISILVLIVAPRVDYQHYQIEGGMQAVATTLMAAQREAVAKQHNVAVMFDSTGPSLRILYDLDNDNAIDANERVRILALERQVRFGLGGASPLPAIGAGPIGFTRQINGVPAVIFRRNGSASEAGGLYLTSVRAESGDSTARHDTRALELLRATGRPEWYRYNGSTWTRGF